MGAGAFLEPLAVVFLLLGGAWINRVTDHTSSTKFPQWLDRNNATEDAEGLVIGLGNLEEVEPQLLTSKSRSLSPSLLSSQKSKWRTRELRLMSYGKLVETPNTAVFRNRFLSRVLYKFPFLVEAWYWALVYWVSANHRNSSKSVFMLTHWAGISTRPCFQCSNDRERHSSCRTQTCSATH